MRKAQVGFIQVGKRADLVLLAKDPTQDIRNTRAVLKVWKKGTEINLDSK